MLPGATPPAAVVMPRRAKADGAAPRALSPSADSGSSDLPALLLLLPPDAAADAAEGDASHDASHDPQDEDDEDDDAAAVSLRASMRGGSG